VENSIDAVGSRDFILEPLSALTLNAITLSRLAEDLIVWSSAEFGTVELPDEFTSTSSIMPQKKNPEVLEVIRARASYVLGDFVTTAGIVKSLPTTYNLDFQEVTPKLWTAISTIETSLHLFAQLIPNIKVLSNIEQKASAGFVGATELANMLVSKYSIAFRTAHKIVGAVVKTLVDSNQTLLGATPELFKKVAMQTCNVNLVVNKKHIEECTNPAKLVETYKVQGGPSPVEIERALKQRKQQLATVKSNISKLNQSLVDAKTKLDSTVNQYSLSSLPQKGTD
jgi:argininosuccinate lyase